MVSHGLRSIGMSSRPTAQVQHAFSGCRNRVRVAALTRLDGLRWLTSKRRTNSLFASRRRGSSFVALPGRILGESWAGPIVLIYGEHEPGRDAGRFPSGDRSLRHDPFAILVGDAGNEVVVSVVVDHYEPVPLRGGGEEQVRELHGAKLTALG